METKDCNNIEKISKRNHELLCPKGTDVGELKDPYADPDRGIVRIEREAQESEEEFHTHQEHHNANHALYYFSMITEGIVRGRTTGNDGEKTRRIREHLMTLREFIGEEKAGLKEAISRLLERLEVFRPVQRRSLARFIYENWPLILTLARAYGHDERCFPEDKYRKLRDVVLGVCAKEVSPLRLIKAFFNNKMTAAVLLLACPGIQRNPALVERMIYSLEDIFHHFCPGDRRLEGLFEELIAILKKCPDLTEEDSRRGIRIAGELPKAFDGKAPREAPGGRDEMEEGGPPK